MARISKHGRELLRVMHEREVTDAESSTDWRRITRAYFSDGKVLEKLDVHFKPSTFQPKGESYSYGWKLKFKCKPGVLPETAVEKAIAAINAAPEKGWKILSGPQPKAVVISQTRIMRAIEEGDNLGFCKACGAEAYGVEPDARNYACESCGAHEVYGAEEMLLAG